MHSIDGALSSHRYRAPHFQANVRFRSGFHFTTLERLGFANVVLLPRSSVVGSGMPIL